MKILVIEDLPADARIAQEYIRGSGLPQISKLDIVPTLAEAIEKLSRESYDVLLTDLNLPDAVGDEAYHKIAKVAPQIPVIILSGNEDEETAAALVGHGAQDYLSKSDLSERMVRRSILYAIERKALEERLRTAQEELIFAEKMESTGHLAAGVAHEVKNPLAIIQLGLDTVFELRKSGNNDSPMIDTVLDRMQNALLRADKIIHELLDFSSEKNFHLELTNIHQAIEKALDLIAHQLDLKGIEVECHFARDLPELYLDISKLEQAMINLLVNAQQVLTGRKTRRIRIQTEQQVDPADNSTSITIRVEDSGPGIAPEDRGKVFDAFFTTKDPDQGTGLGLTVVQRIVSYHDGTIALASSENLGGLCVEIRLPLGISRFT